MFAKLVQTMHQNSKQSWFGKSLHSLSLSLSLSPFLYFTCNSKHFSHIFLCKIHFGFRICGTFQRETVAASRTSRAETVTKVTPLAIFFFLVFHSQISCRLLAIIPCVCALCTQCAMHGTITKTQIFSKLWDTNLSWNILLDI